VLFVNVASACGFTPQYADLNKLYDTYKSKGFEIVAQPCNQFGGQEPGSCEVIKDFASRRGAEFTLLEKADVSMQL
jgi:glutathione peroxidase